jgi:integrase
MNTKHGSIGVKIRFLNTNIGSLKPGTHFDTTTTGLVLRVGKKRRSWQLRARVNGTLYQERLGLYPAIGLADVREVVREKIRRLERGLPAALPAERTRQENGELTLGGLIDRYEQYRRTKGVRIKNLYEQLRHLRKSLDPWLDKPATEITKADIREARDLIAERGALGASNKALAYLQPVFKWASQEDLIPFNFVPDVVRLGAPQTRERFLADDEIGLFWQATQGANTRSMAAYCRLLRFLLLTGQRLGEASGMDWQDVTGDTWHQADNKAGRPHNVPLSPLALACMNGRHDSGLVFAGQSGRMSGWGKLKLRLDVRCEIEKPWQTHDLRRSCASGLQRLGVDRETISAVLNHSIAGVTGVYMRDRLEPQKREALHVWADHVAEVVR